MSQDPENFDTLRKLLALKRHEQPPPGYFDQLASEVMSRLQSGEHRQTDLWKEIGDEASWVQRVLNLFSIKPALAGAFGMVVCGAVLTGLYYSQPSDPQVVASKPLIDSLKGDPLALSRPEEKKTGIFTGDTNPTVAVNSLGGTSLFNKIGIPGSTVPVSYSPGGN